jgi:hypothetical protein
MNVGVEVGVAMVREDSVFHRMKHQNFGAKVLKMGRRRGCLGLMDRLIVGGPEIGQARPEESNQASEENIDLISGQGLIW